MGNIISHLNKNTKLSEVKPKKDFIHCISYEIRIFQINIIILNMKKYHNLTSHFGLLSPQIVTRVAKHIKYLQDNADRV